MEKKYFCLQFKRYICYKKMVFPRYLNHHEPRWISRWKWRIFLIEFSFCWMPGTVLRHVPCFLNAQKGLQWAFMIKVHIKMRTNTNSKNLCTRSEKKKQFPFYGYRTLNRSLCFAFNGKPKCVRTNMIMTWRKLRIK